MTTPTPRTDQIEKYLDANIPDRMQSVPLLDFARQLERELAEAQSKIAQADNLIDALNFARDQFRAECKDLLESRNDWREKAWQGAELQNREMQRAKKAEAERDALKADAERYRWLRQRIEVRQQQNESGAFAPALVTGIGAAFLHIPAPQQAHKMKRWDELDAAIDAAMKEDKA